MPELDEKKSRRFNAVIPSSLGADTTPLRNDMAFEKRRRCLPDGGFEVLTDAGWSQIEKPVMSGPKLELSKDVVDMKSDVWLSRKLKKELEPPFVRFLGSKKDLVVFRKGELK